MQDYEAKITVTAGNGQLIVPIVAMASRAMLDFPDSITLPDAIVKVVKFVVLVSVNIRGGGGGGVFLQLFIEEKFVFL